LDSCYLYVGAPERYLEFFECNASAGFVCNGTGWIWHPSYAELRKNKRFTAFAQAAGLSLLAQRGWPDKGCLAISEYSPRPSPGAFGSEDVARNSRWDQFELTDRSIRHFVYKKAKAQASSLRTNCGHDTAMHCPWPSASWRQAIQSIFRYCSARR